MLWTMNHNSIAFYVGVCVVTQVMFLGFIQTPNTDLFPRGLADYSDDRSDSILNPWTVNRFRTLHRCCLFIHGDIE
jgi:hypothetical protein